MGSEMCIRDINPPAGFRPQEDFYLLFNTYSNRQMDPEQDDKPGYVAGDHLSRPSVTERLQQPTREQTGRLTLHVRPCFEWGLHVPSLLPARR